MAHDETAVAHDLAEGIWRAIVTDGWDGVEILRDMGGAGGAAVSAFVTEAGLRAVVASALGDWLAAGGDGARGLAARIAARLVEPGTGPTDPARGPLAHVFRAGRDGQLRGDDYRVLVDALAEAVRRGEGGQLAAIRDVLLSDAPGTGGTEPPLVLAHRLVRRMQDQQRELDSLRRRVLLLVRGTAVAFDAGVDAAPRIPDGPPAERRAAFQREYDKFGVLSRTATIPDGVMLIAQRRARHSARGHDAAHDAAHEHGELAKAGAAYALHAAGYSSAPAVHWPWPIDQFHGSTGDPVSDLVEAGAFIAAEIDRILRLRGGL